MKKLYKLALVTVVCAEDEYEAKRYIADNDKIDHLAFQAISEISCRGEIPWGWSEAMCPLDAEKSFKDPWHDLSIEEILEELENEVAKTVTHAEMLLKYRELEKRLAKLEEKL